MKIAYILLSNGLEYDDRIRKEMLSMREMFGNVDFKIFAFSGDDNHKGSGVLSYGVPYEFVTVKHRENKSKDIISLLRKEYNFYSQIKEKVKDYDLLWCCDEHPVFFPMFSDKPIIWDLHEIPGFITGGRLKNFFFHRMERRCLWLIHANNERKEYLVKTGVIKYSEKHLVIRNYPNKNWLLWKENISEAYNNFQKWLGGDEYIYIQGINLKARFPLETLTSIMEAKCMKAVVVGSVSDDVKKKIADLYPDSEKYIYYTGKLVQLETAAFIANCKFSIVFYNVDKPNNRLCEPNRMFQTLGMGKPVLVGLNEPMKNVVEQYNVGIVLETPGNSVSDNVVGIKRMIEEYEILKKNALSCKDNFTWESQTPVFKKLLKDYL